MILRIGDSFRNKAFLRAPGGFKVSISLKKTILHIKTLQDFMPKVMVMVEKIRKQLWKWVPIKQITAVSWLFSRHRRLAETRVLLDLTDANVNKNLKWIEANGLIASQRTQEDRAVAVRGCQEDILQESSPHPRGCSSAGDATPECGISGHGRMSSADLKHWFGRRTWKNLDKP